MYRCQDKTKGSVNWCRMLKDAESDAPSRQKEPRATQQSSSERQRAANEDPNRKRARSEDTSSSQTTGFSGKKLKVAHDAIGLINKIKDWERLSHDDFFAKRSRLLDLLKLEHDRRRQCPDDSYVRSSGRPPRLNYYPLKGTLQHYTDWQFHHFAIFWSQEVRQLGDLKKIAAQEA